MGMFDEALESIDKAISLNPTNQLFKQLKDEILKFKDYQNVIKDN
jgi:hypothetical protein